MQQDIRWLKIAMDQSMIMSMLDRAGQNDHQRGSFILRKLVLPHVAEEIRPIDKFEHHEGMRGTRKTYHFAEFVHLHDVRMFELGDRLSFDLEPQPLFRAGEFRIEEHFDCD